MLTGARHEDKVISDDIIRVAPSPTAECQDEGRACRVGYVVMAMTHPEFGRPRVKALPYGSSIPHIEVTDLRQFQIPRLQTSIENGIADGVEEAARLRDRADELETRLAGSAEAAIQRFVGDTRHSNTRSSTG